MIFLVLRATAGHVERVASGTWVPAYRHGMTTKDLGWVPDACTLPTAERPLRLTEFDDLFAAALRGRQRIAKTNLRWRLHPGAETTARELAGRESACCSFFTFTFSTDGEDLLLDVTMPGAPVDVLDALAARSASGMPA